MSRTFLSGAVVFSGSTLLLMDSTIKAAVLMAMAMLVTLTLRRDSAATRHLVWLVAIAAMLVVPVFSAMLPQWRVLPTWAVIGDQPDERNGIDGIHASYGTYESHQSQTSHASYSAPEVALQPDDADITPRTADAEITAAAADQAVVPAATAPPAWTWQVAVPAIWAAGFILLMLRLVAARIILWQTERSATGLLWDGLHRPSRHPLVTNSTACEGRPTEVDSIVSSFDAACSQLVIRRPITVLIHPAKTIPVVWGVFRHRLLLPTAALEWSGEQLRSVLLHELAHIKRRDTLAQLLAQIACALHWFNPLVWFAAWRLHVERERSCDDMVLASGVRASSYAEHLLHVAANLSIDRWTAACGLAMARKSSLEGRLIAVLSDRLNRRSVTRSLAAAAVVLAVAIAVPLAMLRAADADEQKTDAPTLKAEPKDAVSKPVFESWKTSARSDGKIPGGRIGEMAASLKTYMDLNAGTEAATRCEAVLRKCDATHDWTPAEAAALLDEIQTVAPSQAEWAMRTNIERHIYPGQPLPDELKKAPWGPAFDTKTDAASVAIQGLRMAWLLEPREEAQPLDGVMKSRVLFHNTGKAPVCFATEDWIQSGEHSANDANRKDIIVWATRRLGRRTRMIFRLAPGEYAEVEGHGIGVGSHESSTEKSIYQVGAWIEAKASDVVTFTPGKLLVSFQTWQNDEGRKDSMTVWNELIAARVAQEGPWPATVADRELLLKRVTHDLGIELPTAFTQVELPHDNAPDCLTRLTALLQAAGSSMHFEGELAGDETKFRVTAAVLKKDEPKIGAQLKPATEQKLKWGEPANGLRMALAWPPTLGEPGMGDAPEFYLVVQNVSQTEIRLTANDDAPNPRRLMMRENGRPLQAISDPVPAPGDWLLQPREVAFLRLYQSNADFKDGRTISSAIEQDIRTVPRYSMTAEMTIEKAPAGAWTGKLITGQTRGSADVAAAPAPMHKDARALYEFWQRHARANGDIPGALIGELAGGVRRFIRYNPTWETVPQLNALLPRLDATHDWKPADAIALLDEVAAIKDSPLDMVLADESDRTIVKGQPLPRELADAEGVWGPHDADGLRVAWELKPRRDLQVGWAKHVRVSSTAAMGEALKARLLVHNSGKKPIVVRVPTFLQCQVKAGDVEGKAVECVGIDWTTQSRLYTCRLAPGDYVEINTPGIGFGKDAGRGPWAGPRVGWNVLTQPGGSVWLKHAPVPLDGSESGRREDTPFADGPDWWPACIKARLARELPLPADATGRARLLDRAANDLFGSTPTAEEREAFTKVTDDNSLTAFAARIAQRPGLVSFFGKLQPVATSFKITAADPQAANVPRVVLGPGEYPLPTASAERGDATLKIVGRPVGDRRTNDAQLLFEPTEFTGALPPDPQKLELPDGWGTWAIVCHPSDGFFYLLHKGGVRKIDYSVPGKVTDTPANDLPAEFRDEVKRQLDIHEISDAQQAEIFEKPAAPAATPTPKTGANEPAKDEAPLKPAHEYAQSLFRKWQASARTDGKIPGALIGHVAKTLDDFVKQYPDHEATPKLAALRPKFDPSHDWEPADVVALLDEVTSISTAPVSWADTPMESSELWTVRQGEALPIELKSAAWGEPAPNGLRAAWLLIPRAEQYPLGSVLKARVLFSNTGTKPVVFKTETWHQDDRHSARDANGSAINVGSTWYTGITPMASYRLEPGEYVEVPGHGIAIGAGEYVEERSTGSVGAWIEAKEGDEVRFSSSVDASREGWTGLDDPKDPVELWKLVVRKRVEREAPLPSTAADRELLLRRVTRGLFGESPTSEELASFIADNAADPLETLVTYLQARPRIEPFVGKLPTGEIMFRVIAADPNAAKAPRTANSPGRYVLGDQAHLLLVSQLTEGDRRTNKATIAFISPDPRVNSPHQPHEIALPDGIGTYAFAWDRGTGVVWLIEKGVVRSYDFTNPSQVQELRMVPGSLSNVPEHLQEPLKEATGFLNLSGEPRRIQVLVPEKQFQNAPGTNALQVTWDDIDLRRILNIESVPTDAAEHFPGWLKALDGKPVRVRGYMFPTYDATGLTTFALVRQLNIMSFTRHPRLDESIVVTLADGVTTDYIEVRHFNVEGVFRINPKDDESALVGLYRIEDARIVPDPE